MTGAPPGHRPASVAFVLPGGTPGPVGGYRVVYEYANRLSRRGHDVVVWHVWGLKRRPTALKLIAAAAGRRRLPVRGYRPPWFHLDPSVDSREMRRWMPRLVTAADVVVATSWTTAHAVGSRANGLYLIQSYEDWAGPRELVDATWHLDLEKIVIAQWLADKAVALAAGSTTLVPNAINLDVFTVDVPPADRLAPRVAMLWHTDPWKGSAEGVAALCRVREVVPDLEATLFSVSPRPPDLPSWIEFHQNVTDVELRRIYNDASIFLSPSHIEGSPLPPVEAMACGAALVATDIPGMADRAVHGQTAVLVPVGQPMAMARAVVDLLKDPARRIALAQAGTRVTRRDVSWDRSTDLLEGVLSRRLASARQ